MYSRSFIGFRLLSQQTYRPFHTSSLTLSENNGMFGRFNPWAKKTTKTSDSTTTTTATTATTESIGNVTFDVDYQDEHEFSSWKNTQVMEDINDIHSSIHTIVSEHIKGLNETNWQDASLNDTDIKFKVVKESIKQIGKEIPNLDLNNITTVKDLLAFYERKPDLSETSVEKFFIENQSSLPPNMTFVDNKK
ncbi:uncharacterized protein BX664DRAFT_383985 [Halteromyces radiatus]|uniref:uncharacterized protein n=1 Tax=Halteromyces radiatus TaxID=101107 RepID=UPI00221E9D6D|nr:uncharacterized protein BX664DRAFT_383985 [Halteromyces radiatus]KAI8097748.1 hypothetical protein BX664DRAFT_383985 [Halteromyces radiatus]